MGGKTRSPEKLHYKNVRSALTARALEGSTGGRMRHNRESQAPRGGKEKRSGADDAFRSKLLGARGAPSAHCGHRAEQA